MPDNTWILDVLDDIRIYAELNQMPELMKAMHHAQATLVAESGHSPNESERTSVIQVAFPSYRSSC